MTNPPLIDERILEDIPDALIRPLLAVCLIEMRTFSIEQHEQLIAAIQDLVRPYEDLEGEGLSHISIQNRLNQRLQAMRDAQDWAQETDPAAQVLSVEINRWFVDITSTGASRRLLVAYESAGLDPELMEETLRPVITEAGPADR